MIFKIPSGSEFYDLVFCAVLGYSAWKVALYIDS